MSVNVEDLWVRKDKSRRPNYGKGLRWRVVWDDDGKRKSKSFHNRAAANQHKTAVEHQQLSGTYVSSEYSKRTLGDYWPHLEELKRHRAPKTQEQAANAWRIIEAKFGGRPVRDLRAAEITAWLEGVTTVTGARMSHSGRVKVKQTLSALLDMAVDDRVIQANPAKTVKVRTDPERPHVFLDAAQVGALVEHTDEFYRPLMVFMLGTGLRLGEALEVRVGDVDFATARLTVSRTFSGGRVSHTKGRRERVVPLPRVVLEELATRAAQRPADGLLFTSPGGGRIDAANFRRRVFYPAARSAGLPEGTRPHTLRHTFASAAASAGVAPKVLQMILGHADIRTTLGVYVGAHAADLDQAAATVAGFYGRGAQTALNA